MDLEQFRERKKDHIALSLDSSHQAQANAFDAVTLPHNGLPELDSEELSIETCWQDYKASSPFFISSMTAGHEKGDEINEMLAKVASQKRWPLAIGSQRRELVDGEAKKCWSRIRDAYPELFLMGNIGITELITYGEVAVLELAKNLGASLFFVHTNPLQECLQPEGEPRFKGAVFALEKLCKKSPIPIVLKETGCGFSKENLYELRNCGLYAVDVAGMGGTHWGKIESSRRKKFSHLPQGDNFASWGIPTPKVLAYGQELGGEKKLGYKLWASGGIRHGVDAAKAIAMGAQRVGFAKLALEHVLQGEESALQWMEQVAWELKTAMFCTGSKDLNALQAIDWQWRSEK